MRAVLIPADGSLPVREVTLDNAGDSCLDALQALVGGDIETLPVDGRDDVSPYFHGEGKYADGGLPRNDRATRLLRATMFAGDWIAGDLVLTGFDASTGETVPLADDVQPDESTPVGVVVPGVEA